MLLALGGGGHKTCLGCGKAIPTFLEYHRSNVSTNREQFYLCDVCVDKENRAITHLIQNHTPEQVVLYQDMMRTGYRRRSLLYQLDAMDDPSQVNTFMDRFAIPTHTDATRLTVH